MRHLTTLGCALTFTLASLTGCTSKQLSSYPAATGGGGSTSEVTSESDVDRQVHANTTHAPDSGTGHRFTPRTHIAHEPHRAPPHTGPRSIPRFEDGSRHCFRQPRYEHSSGGLGLSGGSAYGQGFGSGHGRLGGSHKTKGTAPPKRSLALKSAPRPQAEAIQAPRGSLDSSSAAPRAKKRPAPRAPQPLPPQTTPMPPTDDGHYQRPPVHQERDWGASVYLSNDDTMSLSSAQRLIYAIDQYAPIQQSEIRPHELLNYFSFDTAPVPARSDFSVVANIDRSPDNSNAFTLGFAVQGRPLTTSTRRNANISYVVDRSGSMSSDGRMQYVKRGMLNSLSQLKSGDIVHISLFDNSSCALARNFVVGRDNMRTLESLIRRITPRGSTNLHQGLVQGYELADHTYQPDFTNRVIMITDANANTGVTNETMISLVGKHYDERRIRLSGVGVGRGFNDSLLDSLTERGKGAYVFLGSDAEVDAVFGERFVSLIETVANDVHFRVHLPPSLALQTFYGEEASAQKERVQAIHYFANTSQMFLSDVVSRSGNLPGSDDIMFTIEYQEPETGQKRVEEFAWNIGQISGASRNLNKAMLISRFARDLGQLAANQPSHYGRAPRSVNDPGAYGKCEHTRADLSSMAAPLHGDPEVSRVTRLWNTYCERYQVAEVSPRPVQPTPYRNNEYAPRDTWPSASR